MKLIDTLKAFIEDKICIEDLSIKKRTDEYVAARSILYNVGIKLGVKKFAIGKAAGRNHVCVINSEGKLNELLKKNRIWQEVYIQTCVEFDVASDIEISREVDRRQKRIVEKMLEENISQFKDMMHGKLESHKDLIELITSIPEKHIETVKTRLKPMVEMLPA